MTLLMVHEQREGHGAVAFGAIIERTPPPLRAIYKGTLAVPLYDGDEHERACLRVMLNVFSDKGAVGGSRQRQWRHFLWQRRPRGELKELTPGPLLLETEMASNAAISAKGFLPLHTHANSRYLHEHVCMKGYVNLHIQHITRVPTSVVYLNLLVILIKVAVCLRPPFHTILHTDPVVLFTCLCRPVSVRVHMTRGPHSRHE